MSTRIKEHTTTETAAFPAESLRSQFPALQRAGPFTFFDNAAGAQVPQVVLDAVNFQLLNHNVQRGGRYPQSVAVDAMIARSRAAVAAWQSGKHSVNVTKLSSPTLTMRRI
jgi:selenocysteine lyase/cysteine desulfurase